MKSLSILIIYLFCLQFAFAQNEIVRTKTKAQILEITKKRTKKYTKEIARVSYVTEKGEELESTVELMGLPLLGSFKSVGDEIEIYYDQKNPGYIETKTGSYLTQYGMYVLIILGIFFSYRTYKNAKENY